ncbi:MAG: RlmE family RNA methyltransferase [Myxococcota bacterium]
MTRGKQSDHYTRRAKKEGRPARSVYKLQEIDEKHKILRKGAHVLDLGCAPGSWIQYAAERVGPSGRALGFDLKPVEVSLPAHAEAHVGDAFELRAELEHAFDVILSDMAPATSGDRKTDALRSAGLVERALDVAEAQLKPGGAVVLKVFEGGEVPQLVRRMQSTFEKVIRARPDATRKHSVEIFLVGLRKRA